ncbi:MAG: ABC transporter permease [Thermaerobacter sp.]|nr:ABC transporter permease [Thermaerobacter sp.]
MGSFIVRRLIWTIVTIWAILTVTYFIAFLVPADPARLIAGQHASAATLAAIRHHLGLDKPLWWRYLAYFNQFVHGNLGYDFIMRRTVSGMVLQAAPYTLYLAVVAVFFEILIGIPVGIISAVKRYSFIDNFLRFMTILGISMPTYWVGSLLLVLVAFKLGVLPLGGVSPAGAILPGLAVGITGSAFYARILRSATLDVMRMDYVRTARAKGIPNWGVLMKHTVRNALIPVVTYFGLDFGTLLGGLIVTETIFNWTGLGFLLNTAIGNADGSLIMGITLFSASSIVIMNLLVDIAYAFLDPRVSYS